MAQVKEELYRFVPVDNSLAAPNTGKGSITIPGHRETRNVVMIVNASRGVIIASQFDPAKGWTREHGHVYPGDPDYPDPFFPNALDGTCKYILDYDTSGMSRDDQLSILIDDYTQGEKFRPWDFGTDAIERMRVSNPVSLIDADFEYGIQNTKWQNHGSNRRYPSYYEVAGPPITASAITSGGQTPYSTITVTAANNFSAGDVVSVTGTTDTNADGLFLIETASGTAFTYKAKGSITSGSIFTSYAVIKKGGVYTDSALPVSTFELGDDTAGVDSQYVRVTFSEAHGLVPGSPITVLDSNGTTAWTGNFFTTRINSPTQIEYNANAAVTGTPGTITIYARNDSFFIHRPFDGGVLMGPLLPVHGLEAKRQSRQYFRYQSGKGFLFSTGALMNPSFDVENVEYNETYANEIFIETEVDHALQTGATIFLEGVSDDNYYGSYTVKSIKSSRGFTVDPSSPAPATTSGGATLSSQPKISVTNWTGAVIRTGMFDDQNGLYWEYDGQQLYAVKRSSTFQTAGTVSLSAGSKSVTGSGTRFLEQFQVNDLVVIRGISYRVTGITSNTALTVSPANRGAAVSGVKMIKTVDERVPQKSFNYDTINAHGPSGYNVRLQRMQMWGIQFSWYGAGFADFMIRGPLGNFVRAHRFANHNVNTEAYLRSANLPARYEVDNCAAYAKVVSATGTGTTDIILNKYGRFPEPVPGFPAYVLLQGVEDGTSTMNIEIISYTGKSSTSIRVQGTGYVVGEFVNAATVSQTASGTGFQIEVTAVTDVGGIARWRQLVGGTGYTANDTILMEAAAAGGTQAQIGGNVTAYSLTVDGSGTVTSGPGNPCLTGISRAQDITQFLSGASRTFRAQTTAVDFAAGSTAMLLNTTFAPTISHWGSSVIMDGGFEKDDGFLFNYEATSTSVAINSGETVLAFRAAPSVSDTLVGDYGEREVINREQIRLKKISVTNIDGVAYQFFAIANPSNLGAVSWQDANVQNIGTVNLFQPTFAQVANSGGLVGTTTDPEDGEVLFQFIGAADIGSTEVELDNLKPIQNSIISGPASYPDGPEAIAFYIRNGETSGNNAGAFRIVLEWEEAQA